MRSPPAAYASKLKYENVLPCFNIPPITANNRRNKHRVVSMFKVVHTFSLNFQYSIIIQFHMAHHFIIIVMFSPNNHYDHKNICTKWSYKYLLQIIIMIIEIFAPNDHTNIYTKRSLWSSNHLALPYALSPINAAPQKAFSSQNHLHHHHCHHFRHFHHCHNFLHCHH